MTPDDFAQLSRQVAGTSRSFLSCRKLMHVICFCAFHGRGKHWSRMACTAGNRRQLFSQRLERCRGCWARGCACESLATCFQHYYMQTLHLKGSYITSLPSSCWTSSDLFCSVWQKHRDLSGNQAGGKFLTSWLREGEWFQAVENAAFCAARFLLTHPLLPGTGISLCAQQTDFLFNNTLPITQIT